MSFSIDFMKYRKIFLTISAVVIVLSLSLFFLVGLNFGIDFIGGNVIQVELNKNEKVSVGEVRQIVSSVVTGNSVIQEYGDAAFIIRIQEQEEDARIKLIEALKSKYADMQVLGFEKVGPAVGAELRRDAYIGIGIALLGILLYITFRFQFRFAVVSVLALIHDAVVVIGVFCLIGMEVNATFIAAMLTIVGYSLNNTIVIIDRIRENWKYLPTKKIAQVVNDSTNQTLLRTINMSLTTIFPIIALYVWGGPTLTSLSFAFLIGMISGTYTSMCITTSLICEWWLKKPIA